MRHYLKILHRAYVQCVLPQPQLIKRFIARNGVKIENCTGVEIGCGTAPFRGVIRRSFLVKQYLATDIAPSDQTDIIAHGAWLPLADNCVNLVAGFQVLQHLQNHKSVLSEAFRILDIGGYLLLTYPFMYGECDVHDTRRWTMEGMRADCAQAGFEIVAHEKIGGILFMLTSFLVSFISQVFPGGRQSWRATGSTTSMLRIGITTVLSAPIHLLGWVALLLDRAWPRTPFYMGGIVLAKRV